jgi:dipeptidyl aminopeptidase/acylaminoacyl peptidase
MTELPFRDFAPARRFQPALAISPDGGALVYCSNASGQSNLWRQDVDADHAVQLTSFTDRAVRDVAWSPDGTTLVFTADHEGDEFHQLFAMDAPGGAPRQLTDSPKVQHHLATDRAFSPDGRFVLYAGNDRDPTCQDVLRLELATGAVQRLVAADGLHLPVAFSPDQARVTVVRENSNTDADLLLVEPGVTDPGAPRLLTVHDGDVKYWPGPWTPDGRAIYTVTDRGRDFTGLAELPLDGSPLEFVETPDWDVEQAVCSTDGSRLAWSVNEDGSSRLYVRDLASGQLVDVPPLPEGVVSTLRISADGRLLVFLLSTATGPTEVASVDLAAGRVHVLTNSTPPALRQVHAVEPQLVRFPTHDGRSVAAFAYRPQTRDGRCPVVVSIHGGPEAQERPVYAYAGLYQYLLANGIGVLAPNVRGSTGYGSAYQRLIHHDWGGDELRDFGCAVQYLRSLDWVDPDRIGVFGGSFGGFATLSCVSRLPDLWAAAVSVVGPSNLVTFVQAVPPTWRRLMAAWVGDAETERDFLLSRSPISYADDIVAPLFVIQGANDPRVVKAESDQIVERLRQRGVDVRYDVYADEGHGFTKRENEIKALGDAAEFLITHLH